MIKTDNSKVNVDLLAENQRLREQLDAWAEKYADLKIKSDANQWAHDNMQEQLAKEINLKDSWRAVAHKLEQDKLDLKYALAGYKELHSAAKGLSFGTCWNKGTHALLHGYRQALLDAVKKLEKE